MRCERYKEALIDAAASGEPLPRDLRAHLDSCGPCHATFEDERRLLAAIDSSVRATANASVPPSLLPAVDVRLSQEDASNAKRSASANWIYVAAAAALILALLPLLRGHRDAVRTVHGDAAENAASFAPTPDFLPQPDHASKRVVTPVRSYNRHASAPFATRVGTPGDRMSIARTQVLVPPDQELLLERYARALHEGSLRLTTSDSSKSLSLGSPIDLIEVANVQLSPLPDLGSD